MLLHLSLISDVTSGLLDNFLRIFSWRANFKLTLRGHFLLDYSETWPPPPVTCWASGNVKKFSYRVAQFLLTSSKSPESLPPFTQKWPFLALTTTVWQQKLVWKRSGDYHWRGTCPKVEKAIKQFCFDTSLKKGCVFVLFLWVNPKLIRFSKSTLYYYRSK